MESKKNSIDELYTGGTCCPGAISKYDIWTRGNVAEVFPDIITPLSWSLWSETMNELQRNAFRYYTFSSEVKKKCFIKLEKGRVYYNVGLVNHYIKKIGWFPIDGIIGGGTAYEIKKTNHIHWFRFATHILGNRKSEKNNKNLEQISYKKSKELTNQYKRWQKLIMKYLIFIT